MPMSLLKSERGNIAVLTALALPVVIALSGGVIEYTAVINESQRLKAAADSAALAAVNEAHIAFRNQDVQDLEALIETVATSAFRASLNSEEAPFNGSLDVNARVDGKRLSVSVDYEAKHDALLMSLAGIDTLEISGDSSATVTAASYANLNFLFDVSHSMGIGATHADQEIMANLTNCAFACHIGGSSNSSYRRVQDSGAKMRIDVAREAAIDAVQTAQAISSLPEQMTYSVHTFDNLLHEVLPIGAANSSDAAAVQTAINSSVQLTAFDGGTNIELAIRQLAEKLPMSGSGTSAEDRAQYVLVLTDGVESTQARLETGGWVQHPQAIINSPWRRHANHEVNYALNPDVCKLIHDKKIIIYFIYTEYDYPAYGQMSGHNQQRFGFIENTLFTLIPQRFEDCTQNADRVFRPTNSTEIHATFRDLLGDLASPLRLN